MSGPKGKGRKRTPKQRRLKGRSRMARSARRRGYAMRRNAAQQGMPLIDGQAVDTAWAERAATDAGQHGEGGGQ